MQQTSRKSKRRRQRQIRNRCISLFAILLLLVALLTHLSTIQNVIVRLGQGLVTSRTLEKEDYPQSLIDLYERNTEARQFVLDYKTKKDDNAAIDVSADEYAPDDGRMAGCVTILITASGICIGCFLCREDSCDL